MTNNVCITTPKYARVNLYPECIHIRVSFPIKKEIIPYLNKEAIKDLFQIVQNKKGQSYIAKEKYISYSDCKYGIQDKIWETTPHMKASLMKHIRLAKIALMKDEIETIQIDAVLDTIRW